MISAAIHKTTISPIKIDSIVRKYLSTNDTIPMINPSTPKGTINEFGKGILIERPKVTNFIDINIIKSKTRQAACLAAKSSTYSMLLRTITLSATSAGMLIS